MTGSRIEYSQRTQARDFARDDAAALAEYLNDSADFPTGEPNCGLWHTAASVCDVCGWATLGTATGGLVDSDADYWQDQVDAFDFEATVEEIDQMAADLFARAEADRAREFTPVDPWSVAQF